MFPWVSQFRIEIEGIGKTGWNPGILLDNVYRREIQETFEGNENTVLLESLLGIRGVSEPQDSVFLHISSTVFTLLKLNVLDSIGLDRWPPSTATTVT